MNITCAITGHKWRWLAQTDIRDPYRCERCGRYDDEPKIVRAANCRAAFNRWSPVTVKITRRELTVRAGLPWHRWIPSLSLTIDLHYGWDRTGVLPGIRVRGHIWRLRADVSLGGLWHDEDGEVRALSHLWVGFETYGLRWIGCWLGHKPEQPFGDSWYCDRCDELLERADEAPRKAAA